MWIDVKPTTSKQVLRGWKKIAAREERETKHARAIL
jgi:hypothetical protein